MWAPELVTIKGPTVHDALAWETLRISGLQHLPLQVRFLHIVLNFSLPQKEAHIHNKSSTCLTVPLRSNPHWSPSKPSKQKSRLAVWKALSIPNAKKDIAAGPPTLTNTHQPWHKLRFWNRRAVLQILQPNTARRGEMRVEITSLALVLAAVE